MSSRLTGEIGSSSNPISGMTVATLLLTCLVFLLVGWTGPSYYVTALSVGAIVCIAASNGGTTSQDLKTGFLVGATPRNQQIAILVGALASALVLGPILLPLNDVGHRATCRAVSKAARRRRHRRRCARSQNFSDDAAGRSGDAQRARDARRPVVSRLAQAVGRRRAGRASISSTPSGTPVYLVDPGINGIASPHARTASARSPKFDAPKATLMSYIIKGILNRQLPWGLVLLGVMIALVLEMSGVPSLAFAVGVYLPLSSSSPIFIGGMVRWLGDRYVAQASIAASS